VTGAAPAPAPGRIAFRAAVPDDAAAIARVQVSTWRATYRGIVPGAFLDGIRVDEWAARRRGDLETPGSVALVAEEGGVAIGFLLAGRARGGPPGHDAEVHALYVLRERQRRGVGRRLLRDGAAAVAARGHRSLLLWVLRDNAPARAFYERLGGRVVASKEIEIGGAALPEVAYGWPDLGPLLGGGPSSPGR
jgi:ribosomal protein S18 acetylase RimI-like enzyme